MNAVFNSIVNWESNYAMSYGCPLSRSVIMRQNKLNLYQYRKQVKELKEKGLIKYERYIERTYCEGFLEDVYFIQGWRLTDKGRNTELFKQALEQAENRVENYLWSLGEILAIFLFKLMCFKGRERRSKPCWNFGI